MSDDEDPVATPSSAAEQLGWLEAAGFRADIAWAEADLAVILGDLDSS